MNIYLDYTHFNPYYVRAMDLYVPCYLLSTNIRHDFFNMLDSCAFE